MRLIPPDDPHFTTLYSLRNDGEGIYSRYKHSLVLNRAAGFGCDAKSSTSARGRSLREPSLSISIRWDLGSGARHQPARTDGHESMSEELPVRLMRQLRVGRCRHLLRDRFASSVDCDLGGASGQCLRAFGEGSEATIARSFRRSLKSPLTTNEGKRCEG